MLPKNDYHFQPKPSKYSELALIAAHGLAAIAISANTLPLLLKMIVFSVITLHLIFSLYSIKNPAHRHIYFSDADGWRISLNQNSPEAVTLLGSTVSTRWIILLHFKLDNSPARSLLICPDSLSTAHYHQLRLMLKLHFR